MRRLLLVEATRARWRRAVLALLGAMVLVPVAIGVFVVTAATTAPGDDGTAEAQRIADEQVALCVADPESYFGPGTGFSDAEAEQACRDSNRPEYFLPYDQLDLVTERVDGSGLAVAVLVALLAMLVGTTFVGHDWSTGSMSNQLLFEPRRLRVWTAKAAAVTAVSVVAAAVGVTAFWLVLAGRYATAGADIPDGALLDGLQQGWRGAAVAGGAAFGGFALTMLSRSTVFTLGVLAGVAVAGGLVIGLLVEDRGWVDPSLNALAVVNDGQRYGVVRDSGCSYEAPGPGITPCYEEKTRSLGEGLLYLGLLSVAGGTASAVSFRRRDVP